MSINNHNRGRASAAWIMVITDQWHTGPHGPPWSGPSLSPVIVSNAQFWRRARACNEHCIGLVSPNINPTFPSFPWAGPGSVIVSQFPPTFLTRGLPHLMRTRGHTGSLSQCHSIVQRYQATFIAPLPAIKENKKEWDRGERRGDQTDAAWPGDAQLMKVRDGCSVFWTGERGHCIIALHFLLCPKSKSHSVWSLLENYFVRSGLAIVTPGSAESVTRDTSRGM